MIIGETVFAPASTVNDFYSPWFKANGMAATFPINVVAISNASLAVKLQTKTSEETDADASETTLYTVTSTGPTSERYTSVEELVRFHYSLEGTGDEGTIGLVHFYMSEPMWETSN